jgi:hypothetical protein
LVQVGPDQQLPEVALSRRSVRLTAALTTAFVVSALPTFTAAAVGTLATCDGGVFAGGDGSVGNPYQVDSRSSLEEVRDCLDKVFVQTADIDLGGTEWTPIGSNEGDGPNYFSGTFDGDDHQIVGLSITIDSIHGVGLFGSSSGTLTNLHVAGNITLSGNSTNVGGITGSTWSIVQYSSSSVTIYAPNSGSVGGLVGGSTPGNIVGSSASGSVTGGSNVGGLLGTAGGAGVSSSVATGAVNGAERVGGLVGSFGDSSTMGNSYARGAVTSSGLGGGLIGSTYLYTNVVNSYSTGTVTASTAGGLIGFVDTLSSPSLVGNLWDTQTSGRSGDSGVVGITGLTTTAMTSLDTFMGYAWDIDRSGTAVWQICAGINDGYPFLTSEDREVLTCEEAEPTDPTTSPTTLPASGPGTLPATGVDTNLSYVIALLAVGVVLMVTVRRRPSSATE